jgi:hypothetical protein
MTDRVGIARVQQHEASGKAEPFRTEPALHDVQLSSDRIERIEMIQDEMHLFAVGGGLVIAKSVEYAGITMISPLSVTTEDENKLVRLRQSGTENAHVVASLLE